MDRFSKEKCLLKRVEEQEVEAKNFGFYWESLDQLIQQIQSECKEIEQAWEHGDTSHLQEEVGDLIQAAVSLAVFCNLDPHETLSKSIDKFQKRYDAVVCMARTEGFETLHHQPFELLMSFWERAKKQTNSQR